MIRVWNLKHRSLSLSFDPGVSFKLTVQKQGGVEETIAEGKETQYAVSSLESNTEYRLRVYSRGPVSQNYELLSEKIVKTPWANFDDLRPDELRHISMFAGGFETDHDELNKVACLPLPNQYRTLPDDNGLCGPTAPTLDKTTGCCIGGADGHELSFLQALEKVFPEVKDRRVVSGSVEYAVNWIRKNNKQSGNANYNADFTSVKLHKENPWNEAFVKLLFAGGIRRNENFEVSVGGSVLTDRGRFHVLSSDLQMRKWMSDTSINGQVDVWSDATIQNVFPYAIRAISHDYLSLYEEYIDITNLSTVLASPDCGFEGRCRIGFLTLCAINRQIYASSGAFLEDIMTAMVVNKDMYDIELRIRYWHDLNPLPATVAPLELIKEPDIEIFRNKEKQITIARKVLHDLSATVNTLGVKRPSESIMRYTDPRSPGFDFQLSVVGRNIVNEHRDIIVTKKRCPMSGTRFWTGTTIVENGQTRKLFNTRDLP